MAKQTLTKQRNETELQWLARKARRDAVERDKAEPIVPAIALANGDFSSDFVTHVETNTKAKTFRRQDELPTAVQQWVRKGYPGFEEPTLNAILWCMAVWEGRPVLGNMAAKWNATAGCTGKPDHTSAVDRHIDNRDELDLWQAEFLPIYWKTFEDVVRHNKPAHEAANEIENNAPQSTASARAIVGLVANVIAMKRNG